MKYYILKLFLKIFILCIASILATAQAVTVGNLRCEHLINPQGIDVVKPRLSWILQSNERGQLQTAYQLIAASTPENLENGKADLWNSGKINSDQSLNVLYAGKVLNATQKICWKVKIWDKNGVESSFSPIAHFSAGLLNTTDWRASWIGADKPLSTDKPNGELPEINARYLRKEFELGKKIKSATLYVCGLGLYEAYINGKKVGDYVLAPAQTEFPKRVAYNTFDVTSLIGTGKNAIGCILGNGRWVNLRNKPDFAEVDKVVKFPKLIAQLEVQFADGSKQIVASDNTWKLTAEGAIRTNNEFDGEYYDATKEMKAWANVGFNDLKWQNAELVSKPIGKLVAQMNEPIKVMETINPIAISKNSDSTYVMDMGQNMVGWIQMKVQGAKGTKVRLRFTETLKSDGSIYLANLRSAKVTDTYILSGEGAETFEPRFIYHGFRYVEITNYPGTPKLENFAGQVVYDAVETIGKFKSENQILNQIYKNAYWGIRGNYRSFPTDCPQRDERQGWLGDRGASSKGESFVFRNITLYAKWLQDINDAQLENGIVPDVAPSFYKIYNDGVTWPSAFVIIPYFYYQNFGDKSVIEKNYDAIKKWSNHMISFLQEGLIGKDTYGDWCVPPESLELIFTQDPLRKTPPQLLASSYLYYDLKLAAYYAKLLNKAEDEAYFEKIAAEIKLAINKNLFNSNNSQYANNSLTSSILPLAFDIVEDKNKEKVFNNLVDKLMTSHQGHVGTGLIGAQWQMKTLSKFGRADLAYNMAANTDYPSWGYMASKGATTIWELWNGDKADPSMNSGNHVMLLGDLITWLYENVGGISSSIDKPGFKQIICKPDLIMGLNNASVAYESMYGTVSSSWKIESGSYNWTLKVPANATAAIYVPAISEKFVKESGKDAVNAEGVKFIKMENDRAVFEIQSGTYTFVSSAFAYPKIIANVLAPVILPKDTALSGKQWMATIRTPTPGAKTYYTTNGTEPNENSTAYLQPFIVREYTIIKAKSYKSDMVESPTASSFIDFYDVNANGWSYKYFEGEPSKALPDFTKMKPISKGVFNTLNILKIKKREDNFGIVFNSNLKIEKTGSYTFYLVSDDGSRLLIDGKEVVINDFVHGAESRFGAVTLAKGYHTIEIQYFEGNYGEYLTLDYQFEGEPRQAVLASKLFINLPTEKKK